MKKEWWVVVGANGKVMVGEQMGRWRDGKGAWEQKYERPSLRGEERYYGWVRRERNLIQTKKKKTGGN